MLIPEVGGLVPQDENDDQQDGISILHIPFAIPPSIGDAFPGRETCGTQTKRLYSNA